MWYPLRFAPLYFEKVWGGRRLETILGRTLPAGEPIGESWEVSDHAHGRGVVANGPLAGRTLHALIEDAPEALLGRRVVETSDGTFPLLVKYIDAEEALSVQVHPDDAYGQAHEGEPGKTEMWYILHADPDACLIAGLTPGTTREAFRAALEGGDPGALLHRVPVRTGDSIFIPAGRIHAIMPGLLILEIQQSSDTTYRLYDWGRLGLDGQPRALHVEQALAVSDWADYAPTASDAQPETLGANRKTVLATCRYFTVEKYVLAAPQAFSTDGASFRVLNIVSGAGTLTWPGGAEPLARGDSLLLPAAVTEFTLAPDGDLGAVVSYVP